MNNCFWPNPRPSGTNERKIIHSFLLFTRVWSIGLAYLILSAIACAADRSEFIVEIKGSWMLDAVPGKRLTLGESLPTGSKVIREPGVARADADEDKIVIALSGGHFARRDKKLGNLDEPIVVVSVEQPTAMVRIMKEVQRLFSPNPKRYISTITRAAGRGDGDGLQEAVVLLKDDHIELGPALKGNRSGKYHLQLRRMKNDEPAIEGGFKNFELNWKGAPPALVAVGSLPPGIYKLTLIGDENEQLDQAWILAATASDFERNSARLKDARILAQSWGNSITQNTARALIRAYLDSLQHPQIE